MSYLDAIREDARRHVEGIVSDENPSVPLPHRRTMERILALAAVAVDSAVTGHPLDDHAAAAVAVSRATQLTRMQNASGLFTSGRNLDSPPDTSFTINDLCGALDLIPRLAGTPWRQTAALLRTTGAAALEGLLTGGVHTPNHRWEVCRALLELERHLPDARIRPRVAQWLAEGIDIDDDGLFSERSANYGSRVSGPSLLRIGELLPDPTFLGLVRRHLRATTDLLDGGEVETVHSRRQDQFGPFAAEPYLTLFRRFALDDGDSAFAAAAAAIKDAGITEGWRWLAETLLHPPLAAALPTAQPRRDRDRVFTSARLVRRYVGDTAATVFAGADGPLLASGRSASTTILRFLSRDIRVDAIRISPRFFGLGPLRPTEMSVEGRTVTLREERTARYYQPLAGPLTPTPGLPVQNEGRFHAAMAFGQRRADLLTLTSRIAVDVAQEHVTVDIDISGAATTFAVEVTLRPGGELRDCSSAEDAVAAWVYETAQSTLRIETLGSIVDAVPFDEGEQVEYLNGDVAPRGVKVLASGEAGKPLRLTFSTSSRSAA